MGGIVFLLSSSRCFRAFRPRRVCASGRRKAAELILPGIITTLVSVPLAKTRSPVWQLLPSVACLLNKHTASVYKFSCKSRMLSSGPVFPPPLGSCVLWCNIVSSSPFAIAPPSRVAAMRQGRRYPGCHGSAEHSSFLFFLEIRFCISNRKSVVLVIRS